MDETLIKIDTPYKRILTAILVFILGIAAFTNSSGQTLKCKLVFTDSIYIGEMRPNWFHKITLKPLTSDYTNLVGASGVLYSNNFGNAGFSIVKNKLKTSDSLMLRATFGWHPIHKIEIKNGKLAFEWNWSFRPAPEPSDLKILLMADHLLGDETSWEKNDDRDCRADSANSKFSLYCAIYQSTKSLTSDFNHRGAALEILRKTIRETKPDKKYQHDMMDFNNQSSFSEIKALLLLSIANLNKSLSESIKK